MDALPLVALIVGAFLTMWLSRFIYFRRRYVRGAELHRMYGAYIESNGNGPPTQDVLARRTSEVHRLWLGAGVEDGSIPYAEPVGWMRLATGHASPMQNWFVLRADVVGWVWHAFNVATGFYEDRFREAPNPVHTALAILTLPQSIVRWLGLGAGNSTAARLLSVGWSLVLVVATVAALLGVSLKDLGLDITRIGSQGLVATVPLPGEEVGQAGVGLHGG